MPKKKPIKKRAAKQTNGLASYPKVSEQKKWETEEALRTLRRAEEIKGNPSLMKRVSSMAKKEVGIISKIAGKK
jgi:hypothetical protein